MLRKPKLIHHNVLLNEEKNNNSFRRDEVK